MAMRFEEIEVWQKARELCSSIYALIKKDAFSKDYELKNQINRSSASIMDNIAEGFERNNNKEFIYFLFISKGSAGETRSQLYRALDRQYITKDEFEMLYEEVEIISKQLGNFISYLKQSELKGAKHA